MIFASLAARRRASLAAAALLVSLGLPAFANQPAQPAYSDTIDAGSSLAGNYLSAWVAGTARDTSAAAFFYREALRDDPRSAELTERAFIALLVEGSYAEAGRLGEKVLARDPNNGVAQLALAVRDLKGKQWSKARQRLSKGGKNRSDDITATLLTAWSYAGSGNGKRALEIVDGMKGGDAIAVFRDYHAGLIADLTGNQAEAEKRLKAAYQAESKTLRMVDVYGRFLARRGKTDEAKQVYRDFDKLLPRHPITVDALARLEAGTPLDSAVPTVSAGAAEVLYGLGAAGNRQGDEIAAMLYLRLALWLDTTNPLTTITLADIYDRLKQTERANDTYDLVAADSPLRRSADVQIALNLEQLERRPEAVEQLQKVLAKSPKDIEALSALGNIYRSRKDFAKAADVYTQAIDAVGPIDNSHWSLFYFRGIAYERTKQWPKAEADFRKALELFPDQPLVLNYLGYSWVDQHMNLDEAFKMLKRAVEQRPTDGYIVDSLGWAYYRLGRYDEAVRLLEKAVELKPADPVINDHLGDAYWRVGRKLEATFQWNHARDLKPEPEDLPKILKKLESGLEDDPKPAAAEIEKKANGG
ncbi:tetratricopeptide repeat protein [Alsobacter sp. R-9]